MSMYGVTRMDGRLETALEAYRRNEAAIGKLVASLWVAMEHHPGPVNWAAVGDLARVAELLGKAAELIGAGPESR